MDLQGLGQTGGRLWEQELLGLLLLPGVGKVGAPAGLRAGGEPGWRGLEKGLCIWGGGWASRPG